MPEHESDHSEDSPSAEQDTGSTPPSGDGAPPAPATPPPSAPPTSDVGPDPASEVPEAASAPSEPASPEPPAPEPPAPDPQDTEPEVPEPSVGEGPGASVPPTPAVPPPPVPPAPPAPGGPPPEGPETPKKRRWPLVVGILAAVAVLGGGLSFSLSIGGDDDGDVVSTLEEVELATIRIEAEGSFVDPESFSAFEFFGTGSGFIVDESGIAVTNNHVVTGAAVLRVNIAGEDSPRRARVLGVSECSDLAVIDIEGDGYSTLEWADVEVQNGLDVFAAGFPLGDPEYTTTRGIVSKPETSGETEWASVEGVIEHDAKIREGNSGGPLVTQTGEVIGVNYAGSDVNDFNFAIAGDIARRVVEQLREGDNVESLGLNGQAIVSEDGAVTGIWVAGVESGSPADKTGITGGDIVTRLEGVSLGVEGTMKEYCDVLRSHEPSDTLDVEVLRYETGQVLEGQINGRELEESFSFRQEFGDDVSDAEPGEAYGDFVTVTDDSRVLSVSVPASWSDVSGEPLVADDGTVRPQLKAAPSIVGFDTTYTTPGVAMLLFEGAGSAEVPAILDAFAGSIEGDCASRERDSYEDALYTGQFDGYEDCAGTGNAAFVIAAVPEDESFVVLVAVNVVTDADLAALDTIIDSFQVLTG